MDEAIKKKILSLLDEHRIMTIATLRPDGWPQATTVGYANEGLTLYFLCGPDSQKAANLAQDDRVSLTIDHDAPDIMAITGLSMAAHAQVVEDSIEVEKILQLLYSRYPEQSELPIQMPTPEDIRVFRVTPGHQIELWMSNLQSGINASDLLIRCEDDMHDRMQASDNGQDVA